MENMPVDILIADDDEIDFLTVKRICSKLNLPIDYAENGKVALEKMQSHAYKLLITDIDMPEMDGLQLIKFLHDNPAHHFGHPTIAVVSGTLDPNIAANYKQLGIDYFFRKPVDKEGIMKIFSILKLI